MTGGRFVGNTVRYFTNNRKEGSQISKLPGDGN